MGLHPVPLRPPNGQWEPAALTRPRPPARSPRLAPLRTAHAAMEELAGSHGGAKIDDGGEDDTGQRRGHASGCDVSHEKPGGHADPRETPDRQATEWEAHWHDGSLVPHVSFPVPAAGSSATARPTTGPRLSEARSSSRSAKPRAASPPATGAAVQRAMARRSAVSELSGPMDWHWPARMTTKRAIAKTPWTRRPTAASGQRSRVSFEPPHAEASSKCVTSRHAPECLRDRRRQRGRGAGPVGPASREWHEARGRVRIGPCAVRLRRVAAEIRDFSLAVGRQCRRAAHGLAVHGRAESRWGRSSRSTRGASEHLIQPASPPLTPARHKG